MNAVRFLHWATGAVMALNLNTAFAVVFTVGSTSNCTHASITAAISAAAANGADTDFIRINSGTYSAQALLIEDQSLNVTGGHASCADGSTTGAATIISGAGNGGLSVLTVNAQGATQRQISVVNLTLTGSSAGGLRVLGYVQSYFAGVTISNNASTDGAGVYTRGENASAIANVQFSSYNGAPSRIEGNSATRGGGVYADNFSFVPLSDAIVSGNQANFGAGVFATGSTSQIGLHTFDNGTPDSGIRSNTATLDGGGVYLQSGAHLGSGRFSENAFVPMVANNTAGRNGGGFYLTGSGSYVLGYYLSIRGNSAGASQGGNGGGLYLTSGSSAYLDDGSESLTCGRPDACVSITDNRAGINGFSGSGGGTYLLGNANLSMAHALLAGNQAQNGGAVYAIGSGAGTYLTSAVIEHNAGAGHSFRMEAGATLNLRGVTLANDDSASGMIALSGATATLDTSIIYDTGAVIITRVPATANTVTSNCVMAHASYVSDSGAAVIGNPLFVNAVAGDYKLTAASPAIDACATSSFTSTDTDYAELPRGFDVTGVANNPGPFDLGAFERQTVLFTDSFE